MPRQETTAADTKTAEPPTTKSGTANDKKTADKLRALKENLLHRRKYPHYSQVELLLGNMLEEISDIEDPDIGFDCMVEFFELDELIPLVDDRYHDISLFFEDNVVPMFLSFAQECTDKQKVVEAIVTLNREDFHGTRSSLIEKSPEYLPEEHIRLMIAALEKGVQDYGNELWIKFGIVPLATAIGETEYAEAIEKTYNRVRSDSEILDIAQNHYDRGDDETALKWLNEMEGNGAERELQRSELLLNILRKCGKKKDLKRALTENLMLCRRIETLEELVKLVGEDKREWFMSRAAARILKTEEKALPEDLLFLVSTGMAGHAEKYILRHMPEWQGREIGQKDLLACALLMKTNKHHLAASLVYRQLVMQILDGGQNSAYKRAAEYMRTLDELAGAVSSWKKFEQHPAFIDRLRHLHGRKKAFWQHVES